MNKFVMRQSLLLLLTATIWGVAFVAQSVGMDYIGPFTFNVVRNVIGGFEEEEVALAMKSGANPVTLGKRILRTETAGLTMLSVLMFHLEG